MVVDPTGDDPTGGSDSCAPEDRRKVSEGMLLEGKIAVITGAGSGVGRASALCASPRRERRSCAPTSTSTGPKRRWH